MAHGDDTIFARSSGAGRAGIAVWRISGSDAAATLECLVGSLPKARFASHRQITCPDGEVIDDGIVLFFPGPNSATGEDLAEFHLHGSPAVGARFSDILTSRGLRPAAPGEFTLRAFINGRMDLLAIEGLGDLLDAETEAQRQQALAISGGTVRQEIAEWRRGLIEALAVLEAAVDFPDEEDIPADIANRARPILKTIRAEMGVAIKASLGAQRLKEGLDLAIVGAPNAGKSSFLNRLAGEDRAIVSDIAGTTRDIVSIRIDIAGRLVNVLDTAGIRSDSDDVIENEGISRSRRAAEEADIIIVLVDATTGSDPELPKTSASVIRVLNKTDLEPDATGGLPLSLKTGAGWEDVLAELERIVAEQATPSFFPRERQQKLVEHAATRLDAILASEIDEPELLAEDLRACIRALDDLVGQSTTEEVLGSIFSSFCVGK